jgi:hypothetical protein
MNNHLVTTIIPTFNHGRFICDALDSVISQSYKEIEIIVVDDGSIDDTVERVAKYGNAVKYLYQENRGCGPARNTGIIKACGNFVAFLDADDIWQKEKIEKQIEVINAYPGTGVVGCGFNYIDNNGKFKSKPIIKRNYKRSNALYNDLMVRNIIYGSSSGALVKKECFNKVGLFDEKLPYREDWDMWFRIGRIYDIRFVEEALVYIRLHRERMTAGDPKRIKEGQRKALNKHIKTYPMLYKLKALSYIYGDVGEEFLVRKRHLLGLAHLLVSFGIYPLPNGLRRLRAIFGGVLSIISERNRKGSTMSICW